SNFLGLMSQAREEVRSDHVLVLADKWLAWVEQEGGRRPADEPDQTPRRPRSVHPGRQFAPNPLEKERCSPTIPPSWSLSDCRTASTPSCAPSPKTCATCSPTRAGARSPRHCCSIAARRSPR